MSEFVSFLSKTLLPTPNVHAGKINKTGTGVSSNPFASRNPFVQSNFENPFSNYGQNKPVIGGYFAGYYNNQPNIVGRKLFIEA